MLIKSTSNGAIHFGSGHGLFHGLWDIGDIRVSNGDLVLRSVLDNLSGFHSGVGHVDVREQRFMHFHRLKSLDCQRFSLRLDFEVIVAGNLGFVGHLLQLFGQVLGLSFVFLSLFCEFLSFQKQFVL